MCTTNCIHQNDKIVESTPLENSFNTSYNGGRVYCRAVLWLHFNLAILAFNQCPSIFPKDPIHVAIYAVSMMHQGRETLTHIKVSHLSLQTQSVLVRSACG